MLAAQRVAVGRVRLDQSTRERIQRGWEAQTETRRRRRAVKPAPEDLVRIGIQVVRVPKKPKS